MQNQNQDLNRRVRVLLLASPVLAAFVIVLFDRLLGIDVVRVLLP
jgi:hypothetical protein